MNSQKTKTVKRQRSKKVKRIKIWMVLDKVFEIVEITGLPYKATKCIK